MNNRNPYIVASQIKIVIPEVYHKEIDILINCFCYKAPEQYIECFGRLSNFCNNLLYKNYDKSKPIFDKEWKLEMISILTTKTKEQLLKEI